MKKRPFYYVNRYPAREVTSRDPLEVAPREVGLEGADIDAIWQAVCRLYDTRTHPAISVCVMRKGQVVLNRALGHLRGNAPGDPKDGVTVPARYDSLFNLYSASKAMTAMVVHLCDERGLLHLDDPVVEYAPEFGKHGKQWVTLRHILTHRAGIPATPQGSVDVELLTQPGRVFELLCDTKPTTVPGRRLAYHALTGGWVIGEVIERVTGRDIRQFFRDEILEPLGIKHLDYGVRPDQIPLVAQNAYTGPAAFPPYSWLLKRSLGVPIMKAVELSNSPAYLTSIIPSGNIVGTAEEACRYFDCLRQGGSFNGTRVFDRRTVRRAVAEQSFLEVDSFLGLPVRYGMGFMLGGKRFSIYGANTMRAFGHIGFTALVAWADPDRELSCAVLTSGKPFITPEQVRWIQVMRVISDRCSPTN